MLIFGLNKRKIGILNFSKTLQKSVDKTQKLRYNNQRRRETDEYGVSRQRRHIGYGSLAQLGEHLPYKQRVTGSSPVTPTIIQLNMLV